MTSIRTRLLALTVVPTLALIVLGSIALWTFGHLTDDLRRADTKVSLVRSHSMMDMMHDALNSDALAALVATTPAEVAQARTDASEHAAWFRREVEVIKAARLSPTLRADLMALTPRLDGYVAAVEKLIAAAAVDRAQAMALRADLDSRFRDLETANESLGDQIQAMGGGVGSVLAAADTGRIWIVVICLVAAIVTISGGILIGRRLVRSMTEAARVLHAIAGGDVSSRAVIDDHTEVGAMLKSLNATLDHIGDMLATIRDTSREVQSTASEVDQVAAKLGANSQRASHDTANASSGATQASGNVQMVAAATEQIAATIRDVARNAHEAARVAANGVGIASRSNASVARLGLSSNEIGAVVDVITQIAEQTNLLALNATIEAARAGAAGRGFAVVANEIKELAKQTARATEEIRTKIVGIQRDTETAVADIGQIGVVIGQIDGIQQSIASAVAEQATVTSDIGRNLTEVATAADSIARDVAAADQAIRDNVSVAEHATSAAATLGNLSRRLEQAVGAFRVREKRGSTIVRPPTTTGRIEVITDASARGYRRTAGVH